MKKEADPKRQTETEREQYMPLRIIAQLLGRRREERHDRAEQLLNDLERVCQSAKKNDEQPLDMHAIRRIATDTLAKPQAELTEDAVDHYLGTLSERERAMFEMCRDGMTASEIAKRIGMERHTVARSLAKIYADLKRSNRHNQPQKEAFLA